LLDEALRKVQYPVLPSISFDAKPTELIRAARELELEGLIAKRKRLDLRAWQMHGTRNQLPEQKLRYSSSERQTLSMPET